MRSSLRSYDEHIDCWEFSLHKHSNNGGIQPSLTGFDYHGLCMFSADEENGSLQPSVWLLRSFLLISDVQSITSCFSGSGKKGKGRGVATGQR